ncbi:MAG: tetratricopeptide repeat protein [Aquificaceae bacterium]
MEVGRAYYETGELNLALEYLKKAEALTINKEDLSAIYKLLGEITHKIGDLGSALYYYSRQLALNRELGDKEGKGVALNNIAEISRRKEEYDKSLGYSQEALILIMDDKNKASAYNNIALVYSDKGEYDKAIEYLQKVNSFLEKEEDCHGVAQSLLKLGDIYRKAKNYKLAEKYLKEGLSRIQRVGDKYWEAVGYESMAWLY